MKRSLRSDRLCGAVCGAGPAKTLVAGSVMVTVVPRGEDRNPLHATGQSGGDFLEEPAIAVRIVE